MKKPGAPDPACPCGSNHPYAGCCAPLHAGAAAPTAEALMRSRYSAYVRADSSYLLATWHPDTRPPDLDLQEEGETRWLGLEVRRHEQSGEDRAIVEFVARGKLAGRAFRLHESSRFVREEGRWLYLDGTLHEKPARPARP